MNQPITSFCLVCLILVSQALQAFCQEPVKELQLPALFHPVKGNHIKLLRHIIFDEFVSSNIAFNVNIQDEKGRIMLHQAAKRGYADIVDLLLT